MFAKPDLVTLHSPKPELIPDLATNSATCSAFIETHSIVLTINSHAPLFCIFWRFAKLYVREY